jgi:hypothetical protein
MEYTDEYLFVCSIFEEPGSETLVTVAAMGRGGIDPL